VVESNAGAQPKIAALDGVRGLAILLVFVVHYSVAWTMLFPAAANDASFTGFIADAAFSIGNAGVDLFICLSGYLIYDHLMRKPQRLSIYLSRRARRIFPPYLIVLAIYVVLMLLDPGKSKLPDNPLAAVAYIAECALLVPNFFGHEPIVGIAWSLTYEMLFYLLLPLLIFAGRLRMRTTPTRIIILLGVATIILAVTWRVQSYERIIMFVGGMLARDILVQWHYCFPKPRVLEALACAAAALALGYMASVRGAVPFTNPVFPETLYRAILLFVGFSTALAATLGVRGVLRQTFEFLPLRLLGEVSYSFYLLHNLVMRVALGFLIPRVPGGLATPAFWLAVPVVFAVCLLLGLMLFFAVELPISLRRPPAALQYRLHAKGNPND
jgi:peptidoglycan/LPS O-acetylase OafA/YrhL